MEEKRLAALAETNGMTKEELLKVKNSSKGPAKPPRQARKPGKQQVRSLLYRGYMGVV